MSADSPWSNCRRCGARLHVGEASCWLCFNPIRGIPAPAAQTPHAVPSAAASSAVRQYNAEIPAGAARPQTNRSANPFEFSSQLSDDSKSGSIINGLGTCVRLSMLVFLGLLLISVSPGFAILYSLLTIPPLVRTMIVMTQREARGKVSEGGRWFELFFTSFSVTIGLAILWTISSAIGFFVLCLAAISSGTNDMSMFFVIGGVFFVVGMIMTMKFIAARFRRDVERD